MIEAVLFDFDGTLAPNLDLPDMRRQVADLTVKVGVPEEIFADLYIVEIIVAGHQWLTQQDAELAAHYKRQADQLIIDIELAAAAKTTVFAGVKEMLSGLRNRKFKIGFCDPLPPPPLMGISTASAFAKMLLTPGPDVPLFRPRHLGQTSFLARGP
ncbi:MAG: hypothetical protein CM15mP68_4550 [Pseudomonadota bacterium]|nr:MAG: hypothetical protein CM15mP68_4550 [Pseudomonadota bacterium]